MLSTPSTKLDYLKLQMTNILPLFCRFVFLWIACDLAACSLQEKGPQLDPFAAINPFQTFNPFVPSSPLAASVVAQWEKEFSQPDFLKNPYWHTPDGRNELVYKLVFLSDYRFSRYEADLVAGRATGDTLVDLAVLGLTSAAALTTPGQATQILAAISGGLIGSRAAIQKNFFQNEAQPVLLRRMKLLRQQKFVSISYRLRRYGTDAYPIERALIDVLDYYNRGTMLGALQAIAEDTAAQEIELRGGQVRLPPMTGPSLTGTSSVGIGAGTVGGGGVGAGGEEHNAIVKQKPFVSSTPALPPKPADFQTRINRLNRQMRAGSEGRVAEIYDSAVKMKDELGLTPLPETADKKEKRNFVFEAINTLNTRVSSDDETRLTLWEGLFANHPANPTFQSRKNSLNRQMGPGSEGRIALIYDAAVNISDELGLNPLPQSADPAAKRTFVFDAINRLNNLVNKDDEARLALWEGLFVKFPADRR